MTGISPPGNPRRSTRIIGRAPCGTVLGRRPSRGRTSGVGAGPRHPGRAHDRGVHGGVMTNVKTIHRHSRAVPERCVLDASGSRSCPHVVRRRPQRRAHVSSRTPVKVPPTVTKVRPHHTSRRRRNANAAHGARLSTCWERLQWGAVLQPIWRRAAATVCRPWAQRLPTMSP
jgi:hypothetical protein